jgi:glycosyltransferase involved in cell wall biosynthesis
VDDWIIGLDRANPSYSYFQDQAVRESFLEAVSISDAVTCTTEPLAKKLRACNDNVHVIPNCVHEEIFELPKPKRLEGAPVTVGWAGGGSHLKDFMQAAPAVRALTGGKRASMLFIGADYEPVIGHHCDYVPYQRDIWDYYKALSAIDIGLAPLATGSLGVLCKSRIRVVEYAARGIPVIATACEAYNDTVRHGETGFLVDRPDQWLEYLDELIYDSGLRESMSYNARAAAREWTIQSPANWKLWESVYGQG